jgi:hypothetical protein
VLPCLVWSGLYSYSDYNSTECPANYTRISNEVVCQAAASAGNLTYGFNGSWSTAPAGCYYYTGVSPTRPQYRVYFNTHTKGSAASTAQPLCSGDVVGTRLHSAAPVELAGRRSAIEGESFHSE